MTCWALLAIEYLENDAPVHGAFNKMTQGTFTNIEDLGTESACDYLRSHIIAVRQSKSPIQFLDSLSAFPWEPASCRVIEEEKGDMLVQLQSYYLHSQHFLAPSQVLL